MKTFPDSSQLLGMASTFVVWHSEVSREFITIQRKLQADGGFLWAVEFGTRHVWNRSQKQFVWDGLPSGRRKSYYRTCRFPDLPTAWAQAQRAIATQKKIDSETVQQWEEAKKRRLLTDSERS